MVSGLKQKTVVLSDRQFRSLDPLVGAISTAGYLKYAGVCREEESALKEERLKEGGRKLKHKIGQAIKNIIKKSSEAVYHD